MGLKGLGIDVILLGVLGLVGIGGIGFCDVLDRFSDSCYVICVFGEGCEYGCGVKCNVDVCDWQDGNWGVNVFQGMSYLSIFVK